MRHSVLNPHFFLIVIGFLIWCPFVFSNEADTVRFAFSKGSPPITYGEDLERPKGILPELVAEVFKRLEGQEAIIIGYPWNRAQSLVKNETMDALCTYPSKSRKEYALFTSDPKPLLRTWV